MAEIGFTQKWEGRRTKKFELWVGNKVLKVEYNFYYCSADLKRIRIGYWVDNDEKIGVISEGYEVTVTSGGRSYTPEFNTNVRVNVRVPWLEFFNKFIGRHYSCDILSEDETTLETNLRLAEEFLNFLENQIKHDEEKVPVRELRETIFNLVLEYNAKKWKLVVKKW